MCLLLCALFWFAVTYAFGCLQFGLAVVHCFWIALSLISVCCLWIAYLLIVCLCLLVCVCWFDNDLLFCMLGLLFGFWGVALVCLLFGS